MPTYTGEVETNKEYQGNVVIRFGGKYYAIRLPDSGLFIPYPRSVAVSSLVLNPTRIDPKSVTTTIASYSFKLLDKDGFVSRVVKDRAASVIGADVEIWLGRSGVNMPFSSYYKMPTTRLSGVSKSDGGYSFSTKETTDRMNRPVFDDFTRLSGDILAGTSTIIAKDDISNFPSSGAFKLGSEIVTYTGKNNATKTFTGCARGAFSTTPDAHEDNTTIYHAGLISSVNPLNILLQLLISGGGGGSYDVLADGLGISNTLIDVAAVESIRDEIFPDEEFSLAVSNVANALQYIEQQLLSPLNVRFTYSRETGLLTLVVLDKAQFVNEEDVIDHDTITQHPKMDIKDSEIVNKLTINWDYDEGTGQYRETTVYVDQDSIDLYGLRAVGPFEWKGVSSQSFVDAFAAAFLERLSTPSPGVEVRTQMDKSLLNIGDKSILETTLLPDDAGALNFASNMEVVSRSVNWQNGEVTLKLAYTSFTGFRLGYISPSDTIDAVTAQDVVELGAGRGSYWQVGWKVLLWDNNADAYTADAVNTILAIDGDEITFADAWATALVSGQHRIKFADYDDVVSSQKRYAFAGINGQDFSPSEKVYTIAP